MGLGRSGGPGRSDGPTRSGVWGRMQGLGRCADPLATRKSTVRGVLVLPGESRRVEATVRRHYAEGDSRRGRPLRQVCQTAIHNNRRCAIWRPIVASRLIPPQTDMALAHHSLVAWKRADDLFIALHRLSLQAFPAHERFELGSQLRRAAYSVAANIVEGSARRKWRERLQFLRIAESSLAEVGYCVHVARRLQYLSDAAAVELETEIRRVAAPLVGLIRATRSKVHSDVERTQPL